jgi:mono/diheme cytochrome c family protein
MAIAILAMGLAAGSMTPAPAQESSAPSPASPPGSPAEYKAVFTRYCFTCHNDRLKTADLILTEANVDNPSATGAIWEKVVGKLRGRWMPPMGMPRPDDATYEALLKYLITELDSAAVAHPNPGRTATTHRLNRAEYTNSVRDLLAIEVDTEPLLPADDSGGFDNFGDLLTVSPSLMEKYISAAGKISRLAVGDRTLGADVANYTISPLLLQIDRMNEDLPFGSRGGTSVEHYFPLDGDYILQVRLQRTDNEGYVVGIAEPHLLDFRLDGQRVKLFRVGGDHRGRSQGAGAADAVPPDYREAEYERNADADLEVRFPAKAGKRLIQVSFLQEDFAPETPFEFRSGGTYEETRLEDTKERAWVDPAVSSITLTGPFDVQGAGETPSRKKIFLCRPSGPSDEQPCARRILSSLARSAYRRPVTNADMASLLSLYDKGRAGSGNFEAGIQMAIEGLLVSTEFLFRIERDPANIAPDTPYPVSDLELASRLSFFLWSSIPDDELLTLAEQGKLRQPGVLAQQVQRMFRDPRAQALVDNFTGQWLFLRNVPNAQPNRDVFAEFDESLRESFVQETTLFLRSNFREDRSVLDLLRADYTYLNERLALHYGIEGIYGNKFRRVQLADPARHGLLGQGGILTITALANRTSPVARGKWVLENLLASPPPPPPANIPPLREKADDGKVMSMRQQMELHRASPACAICHTRMDPIGFALENFDAVGKWRTTDAGIPIDASGVTPDGAKFEGPDGLRQALLNRPELLVSAATGKLLTYALGRTLEYYDAPAVRQIVREAAPSEYRWSSIVLGIVNSTPFQMRRSKS